MVDEAGEIIKTQKKKKNKYVKITRADNDVKSIELIFESADVALEVSQHLLLNHVTKKMRNSTSIL